MRLLSLKCPEVDLTKNSLPNNVFDEMIKGGTMEVVITYVAQIMLRGILGTNDACMYVCMYVCVPCVSRSVTCPRCG